MEETAYTRVVECRRSDGVVVSHSKCDGQPKSNVLYCPATTPCRKNYYFRDQDRWVFSFISI